MLAVTVLLPCHSAFPKTLPLQSFGIYIEVTITLPFEVKAMTFTSTSGNLSSTFIHSISILPSSHKTFCHIACIHSCILACPLSVFRSLCCGTHNNSTWKASLSAYWLRLVCLSQVRSIQLRACIRLLSLAWLFFHCFSKLFCKSIGSL